MAHFQRDEDHLIEPEEDGDLHNHRQAARDRVDLLTLIELHQFLLLLLLVILEALAEERHFRLHRLHLRHRQIRAISEREKDSFHKHSDNQDRDTEIADIIVNQVDQFEERLGDEIEPAPVDHQIEILDAKRDLVIINCAHFFSTGENARGRHVARGTCFNCACIFKHESLVAAVCALRAESREAAAEFHILRRHNGCGPIFIGKAKPARRAFGKLHHLRFFFNRIIC